MINHRENTDASQTTTLLWCHNLVKSPFRNSLYPPTWSPHQSGAGYNPFKTINTRPKSLRNNWQSLTLKPNGANVVPVWPSPTKLTDTPEEPSWVAERQPVILNLPIWMLKSYTDDKPEQLYTHILLQWGHLARWLVVWNWNERKKHINLGIQSWLTSLTKLLFWMTINGNLLNCCKSCLL